jgi:hypothetical protein
MDPVQQVINAWINTGTHPDYHRAMKNKLRKEWSILADALDQLAASHPLPKWRQK